MSTTDERASRLDSVLAEYLHAPEEGRPAGRGGFLQAHPDLAEELQVFFAGEDWMRAAVQSARKVPAPAPLPFRLGKYEVLEELGRGGMGVVYKARDHGLNGRLVALKVIRLGQFASAADVARFREEAQKAAELDHPNIVPIYEFGEHGGQPYFTMKLIEGKSLHFQLEKYRREDPRAAVKLMAIVADAVRYANRRMILHRDLKPGNILVDAGGQPHVTDFGLAKRLDERGEATATSDLSGTLAYMAPEQVSRSKRRLSVAVDVHALGTTLYALLSGWPPFLGGTFSETIRKIEEETPVDLRTLNPNVDRHLSAICLKCLRKDPAQRYENVGVFAERLKAWLDGRPIPEVPEGWASRSWRWCRRHAGAVALAATAGALLLSVAGHFLFRAASRAGRRQEILVTNAMMAQDTADRFRRQFKEWSDQIVRVASDPELARLLETREHDRLQEYCGRMPFDLAVFDSWTVLDAEGTMRARVPDNDNRREARNLRERDYFKGPLEHFGQSITSAHVSRAFRTSHAETYNVALSAPVHRNGKVLGVLRASVSTGTTMGLAQLHDARRRVVVVAPWETSYPQDESDRKPGYRIVLHPSMTPAQKPIPIGHPHIEALSIHSCGQELDLPNSGRLSLHQAGYCDPLDGGSWLAGFAPIGNTGYVVIVQKRDD